jgi:hypothetical protein
MGKSKNKIDAIYQLREAAEKKALVEKQLEERPSQEQRDQLLDAKLDLEKKTIEAIEVCHECGHEHEEGAAHGTVADNVIQIEDRRNRG